MAPTHPRSKQTIKLVCPRIALSPVGNGNETPRSLCDTMGADQSCPCNGDSNVYFPPEEGDDGDAIVVARKVPNSPTATTVKTGEATSLEKSRLGLPAGSAPIVKGKSRKWAALPKDGSGVDLSATSTQVRHLRARSSRLLHTKKR